MAAGIIVFLVTSVLVIAGFLAVRLCVGVLRRRRERRTWDDLVARHQELDRELERIWQHR